MIATLAPDVPPRLDLDATDRCDRCGAQAYVATAHTASLLLWCSHHFSEHQQVLNAPVVIDERHRLDDNRPSISATI